MNFVMNIVKLMYICHRFIKNDMKKIFVFLFASVLFAACSGRNGASDVLGVDELMQSFDFRNAGDTVAVKGFCMDVCGHGSTHITLMGSDSTYVIAAYADESLGSFDKSITYQDVTVYGVLQEQRVDLAFLDDWEYRLDESLKGPNGNPEAVAQLKGQIVELRDSIAARSARVGKNYWSSWTISVYSYKADE